MNTLPSTDKRYSISQAASKLQISTHLLRHWEKKADFNPQRNSKNHRYYTEANLNFLKNFQNKVNEKAYISKKALMEKKIAAVGNKINSIVNLNDRFENTLATLKNIKRYYSIALGISLITGFVFLLNIPWMNAQKEYGTNNDVSSRQVLGTRDSEPEFVFNVNVPTNINGAISIEGDITTTGSLLGLADIDAITQATLQESLNIGGDLEGTLAAVTIATGSITGEEFAAEIKLEGALNITGEFQADGDAGSDGQVLTSTGSGFEWVDLDAADAETLDSIDSAGFLRSNSSDSFTSGALTFADGTYLNLASITHNDSAAQGLKLPQAATFTAPAAGEGFLAYDTDDNQLVVYNGTSWTNATPDTSLQGAYGAGSNIGMTTTLGDINISNDEDKILLFLDESSGFVGIGTTNPGAALEIAPATNGTLILRAGQTNPGTILNVTNAAGDTSFMSIAGDGTMTINGSTLTNAGILEAGDAIHLTDLVNTVVGTAVEGGWTLGSNNFTYRRRITVTNNDVSTALPTNYEATISMSSSGSSSVYTNTQSDNDDFRIAYGSTEIARNVTSYTSSDIDFTFQLDADIAASGSDNTYYIYYSNEDLAVAATTYTGDVQLDSADDYTNWASADSEKFILSQETTIKQEGTGSVQLDATTGNFPTLSTSSQGQFSTALSNHANKIVGLGGTNYLYTIGGESSGIAQSTIYKATIDGSGNIGTHSTASQGQLPQNITKLKIATTQEAISAGDGSDGTLDLSLGSGTGGCNGTGLSWDGGTSTCTIEAQYTVAAGPTTYATASSGAFSFEKTNGDFIIVNGGNSSTTQIFDLTTETFSVGPSLDSMTTTTGGVALSLSNGDILISYGTKSNIYNSTTDTFSLGPVPTGTVGAGHNYILKNDGDYILLHGGGLTTTSVYDPDTNTFSVGPTLPNTIGYGASNFQRTDGDYVVINGNTTTNTTYYDMSLNTFSSYTSLGTRSVSVGGHSYQPISGSGDAVIVLGNIQYHTIYYDETAETFSNVNIQTTWLKGWDELPWVQWGSHTFQRNNGEFVTLAGKSDNLTSIYDPTVGEYTPGPLLTYNIKNGASTIALNNGNFLTITGEASTTIKWTKPKEAYNFTTVSIPIGTTLKHSDYTYLNNTFPTIKATGNITVAGTIDLDSSGYRGGERSTSSNDQKNGVGPGRGKYASSTGGVGGGNGGAGGRAGTASAAVGDASSTYTDLLVGSGGGAVHHSSEGDNGGPGGGGIKIVSAGTIDISGTISANGTAPALHSGGGSGGTLWLEAPTITNTGTISTNGGMGGANNGSCYSNPAAGGGGGGGKITFRYNTLNDSGTVTATGGPKNTTNTCTYAEAGGDGTNNQTALATNLYVVGGDNSGALTTVYKASIDSSGDIGALSTASQTQLSEGRYGHTLHSKTISSTDYMYVIGGHNGTSDQTTVYKATIASNNVGAWSTSGQGQLPVALSDHTSLLETISSSNYLYVIGGKNGSTAQTTVYKATIDSSGDIGTLSTASQGQLPVALYGANAFLTTVDSTNYLYVIGGHNGTSAQTTTYRAVVDSSGDIGVFTSVRQDDLPQALYKADSEVLTVGSNQYVYSIGGNNGSADQTTVYRGQLDVADMSAYYASKTLSSAVDFTNKNDVQYKVYGTVTGSGTFKFSEDNATWQSCAFTVSSADTWETKTCDITAIADAARDAVLYIRYDMTSYDTTQPYTFYFDDTNVLMDTFAGTAPTLANATAVLGEADLTLNAQGTGAVRINYDATNAEAGSGGLQIYNGGSTMLFNLASNGNLGLGTTTPAFKLDVQGTFGTTGAVTLTGLSAGTDNSVIVLDSSNQLVTDEIDSRVWGTSLLDSSTGSANYLSLFSDGDTLGLSSIYETGGNLGIGTTNPGALLDIAGTLSASGTLTFTGLGTGTDNTVLVLDSSNQVTTDEIDARAWGTSLLDSTTGTANYLSLFSDGDTLGVSSIYETGGQIGIGTTAPAYALDVLASGTGVIARFNSANSSGCTLADGGTISCTSDEKLKTNITTLESSALSQVLGLNPVTFDWKSGESGQENLGFIAQDVELIVPQLVSVDAATGYKQLNTIGIIPLLTKAIQEQQTQIEALQALVSGEIATETSIEASESTESTSSVMLATLEGTELQESMLTIYNEFKDFAEALGFIKQVDEDGNDILAITSDLNVTGTTTLADVKITGNLTAGLIEIDTLNNEVNVLGASCYNSATETHNTELCETQELKLMANSAGNLNIFEGKMIFEPNGNLTIAGDINTQNITSKEYTIDSSGNTIGSSTLSEGNTELVIETEKISGTSKVFITPISNTENQVLYVKAITEGKSFTVAIDSPISRNIEFDWWIVNVK